MPQFADIFANRPVLADGAMGTVLYARGIFINRCYDELNLSDPGLILSIHEEYLQAGAEILETNTFGANRFRLARHGLGGKVAEINAAGVHIARQAVEHLKEKQAGEAWVAGSVGPLGVRLEPLGKTGLDEARAAFAEQIRALANAGVDLLIIETMPALNEAREALLAAEETAPDLPVLVMVTVDDESNCLDGSSPQQAAALLTEWGAGAIGVNCSTGPTTVLTAIEAMRAATSLPLAAMPNAGMPRAVEGRNIYLCSPEYMASFARKAIAAGAQIVGGCCGTTPNHIRAMRSAMRAIDAQTRTWRVARPRQSQLKRRPRRWASAPASARWWSRANSSRWSKSFRPMASTAPAKSKARCCWRSLASTPSTCPTRRAPRRA